MNGIRAIETGTLLYIVIAAILASIYVFNSKASAPVVQNSASIAIPLASQMPRIETASQNSPDGKMTLTMKATNNNDETYSYEFSTQETGFSKLIVYRATVDSKMFSVPFNAWSPNNKHFFIYKGGSSNALVFRADGQPISGSEQFINLGEVFNAKYENLAIKEVTGWADPFLVVFNKEDRDGKKASYWLEVPSKAIISLSTNFYD